MNEKSLNYEKKGIKQWFTPSPIKKLAHAGTASRRRPVQQVTTGNSHSALRHYWRTHGRNSED
jgi:hypothetical protein